MTPKKSNEKGDPKKNKGDCKGGCKAKHSKKTSESVDDKLGRYLLNKDHPVGEDKTEWFDKALGYNKINAFDLAKKIGWIQIRVVLFA